jgi:hypothetical protein
MRTLTRCRDTRLLPGFPRACAQRMVRSGREEASTSGMVRLAPCSRVPARTRIGCMKTLAGPAGTQGPASCQIAAGCGGRPRFARVPLIRAVMVLSDGGLPSEAA